jgi:hypothetical protein
MNHKHTKGIEPVKVKVSNEPLICVNLKYLSQPKDSMMRRKEIQSEIERLKRKVEELEGLITETELTRETGMTKITGNHYYTIASDGTSQYYDNDNDTFERDCENYYGVFGTREEADREAAYTLASRRVRAFAKAVNGEWKADWEDKDQEKFGIFYQRKKMVIEPFAHNNTFIHQIAFPTEELAAKALELFRDEWKILANP